MGTLRRRTIATILIGLALIAAAYCLPAVGVWVLICLIAACGQLEFYNMVNNLGIPTFRMVGVACGVVLITATFGRIGPDPASVADTYGWEQLVLLVSLMMVFLRQFPQKNNDRPLATMACTLLGIWYVPLLLNFFTRLTFVWEREGMLQRIGVTGRQLVLYLIVVVKSTDVGAYLIGAKFGRHKLVPRLSPKKTWEGLAGGLACGVLASSIFAASSGWCVGQLCMGPVHAVVLGLLLAGVGVLGDLFESLLKRACNVKDSGAIIPGMGGVLDVLDSLLFAAPALYVYARMVLSR